jgi:hypothetical protein
VTVFSLPYQTLPVDPDEGFPQSFRLVVANIGYTVALHVSVIDETLLAGDVLDLPRPGAYLVMTVVRDGPGTPETIFRRKLVPNLEYAAAELGFVVTRMRVDPRNLNGSGRFGSDVTAGVVRRWAS